MKRFSIALAVILLAVSFNLFAQEQMTPVTGAHDTETVSIDKYVFETALNSADRTITFLQWVIGVFSGVITILFVIFKYRDEKSLEKNRSELKESQDKIEKIRLELLDEENKMGQMLERLQRVSADYESKISGIESKIKALEVKSNELDKKTDNMNEINRNFSIAYSALESGNNEEAIEYYTRIIQSEPDTQTLKIVLNNRGNAYQNAGNAALALKDYQRVLEIEPDIPQVYNNRGIVYESLGDYDKALAEYTKAIELKSDYADAYYNRGNVFNSLNKYNEALADFKKLLQLEPDDMMTKFHIAESFIFTGQLDELGSWLQVIKLNGDNKYRTLTVLFELIYTILKGNENKELEKLFRDSVTKYGLTDWKLDNISLWLKSGKIEPEIKTHIEKLINLI